MTESFADKISDLLCSAPTSFDPENDFNEETAARVVNEKIALENDEKLSALRIQNAPLLEHDDIRYKGKKSSRSKIFANDNWEFDESLESDGKGLSENDITSNESEHESEVDENIDSDEGEEDEEVQSDKEESYCNENDKLPSKLKVLDGSGQINKGESVRHQLKMWESLLEARIKLQKGLTACNKLPQGILYNKIIKTSDSKIVEAHKLCVNSTKRLLDDLLKLQALAMKKFPETKSILPGNKENVNKKVESDDDDDEILTDTDEENDMAQKKRKLNNYSAEISKRHSSYKPYRNSVINKWNEKTKLASSSSSTSHAISSVVNYIDHILSDKEALIKKTQQKHFEYEIMGEDDSESNSNIYDDTDFYHQLLREIIEVKSANITDPIQLSQQWIQLQNLRNKKKKKIDTNASKGRKIKYVVHKEVVEYLTSIEKPEWQEETARNFCKNIFGKNNKFVT